MSFYFLTSFSDINVKYLIHVQKEKTMVNGGSTACHGVNLVLELNPKVLKDLAFSFNSSLFVSVFGLQLLLIYHCVKSVQIQSFFRSVFFCILDEYRKVPTRKNSVFGHFLRNVFFILLNSTISFNFPYLWKMLFQWSICFHDLIALDFLHAFCGCSIFSEKGFLAVRQTVFCSADIPICNKYSWFYKKLCDIYHVFLLFE